MGPDPRNGDGAVVRMYLSESKERFYSFHILASRTVSISVGTTSRGRVRVRQRAATKVDREINRLYWSEWWVAYKSGKVLIGTVENHDLTRPLLSWVDQDQPLPHIEMVELDGYRTKVAYKAECFENILRSDACSQNSDCIHLPKTQCGLTEDDITGIYTATCQCMAGYLPIPTPARLVGAGCYDPIVTTQTVGGECTAQKHCTALANTECREAVGLVPVCQCKKRTKPRSPDPATGLVLGCDLEENRGAQSVDSCQTDTKLHRDKDWVPHFRVALDEDEMSAGTYKTAFYARFARTGALIVRLVSDDLNPEHLYSVHFHAEGSISIYENYFNKHWLGNFPKEKLKMAKSDLNQLREQNTWIGLWIKIRFLSHIGTTIQAGVLSSKEEPLEWTDSTEIAYINVP